MSNDIVLYANPVVNGNLCSDTQWNVCTLLLQQTEDECWDPERVQVGWQSAQCSWCWWEAKEAWLWVSCQIGKHYCVSSRMSRSALYARSRFSALHVIVRMANFCTTLLYEIEFVSVNCVIKNAKKRSVCQVQCLHHCVSMRTWLFGAWLIGVQAAVQHLQIAVVLQSWFVTQPCNVL